MEEDTALQFAELLSEVNFHKQKLVMLEREVSIQVEEMGKRDLTLAIQNNLGPFKTIWNNLGHLEPFLTIGDNWEPFITNRN